MKMKHGMRTPLSRARGLGSTNEGGNHWMIQRLTSIALIPLTIWFVISVVGLVGADYGVYSNWIGKLGNLVMMTLFVIMLFHHAQQGVCEVIHEYIHHKPLQWSLVIASKFLALVLGVACVAALFKVSIGG